MPLAQSVAALSAITRCSKALGLATVSPLPSSYAESLSTLKFAHRAKYIRNDAYVNEDLDQKALLQKYEAELMKLSGAL